MKLIQTRIEIKKIKDKLNGTTALVPTMGNLHHGHISLINRALQENDFVIVTIFVNPKQFGPNEDFNKYPRTLESDLSKLKQTIDPSRLIIFAPQDNHEIYPKGFSTDVTVSKLDQVLCGKYRNNHFSGVTTVVYQLFKLSRADTAYFGQKDFQQYKIIERMTLDLDLPIKLQMCPIIRDDDGLALSSRNQYLTDRQKVKALNLNRALKHIALAYKESLEMATKVKNQIKESDESFQYLEILSADDLTSIKSNKDAAVVAGAYILGDTRLIDNLLIEGH